MSHRLHLPRLFLEILVAVTLSEILVMFALPLVVPGLTGTTEALLKAALLASADMRAMDVHAQLIRDQAGLLKDAATALNAAMAQTDFQQALLECHKLTAAFAEGAPP